MEPTRHTIIRAQCLTWMSFASLSKETTEWAASQLTAELEFVLSGEDVRSVAEKLRKQNSFRPAVIDLWDVRGLLLTAGLEAIATLRNILSEDLSSVTSVRSVPHHFCSVPTTFCVAGALLAELASVHARSSLNELEPSRALDVEALEVGKSIDALREIAPMSQLDEARKRPQYLAHLKDNVIWSSIVECLNNDDQYRTYTHKHGFPHEFNI